MAKSRHLDALMSEQPYEGLTFDDISLVTGYADFLPEDTDISTKLTARVKLNMPFVSAAMDTVTEAPMAIAMALLGGMGVIHKNLSARLQAKQVGVVKHHLHGLILDPIVFRVTDTLEAIRERRREKSYGFSGFPVLDENDKVAGILTSTDIRFAPDENAKAGDVMTRNVITAPPGTGLKEAYEIMMRGKIGKLPLVDDGRLVGLYSFTDVQNLVRNVHPLYNRDEKYRLRVGAAVSAGDHERAEALAEEAVDVIVVDSAHGDSKGVIETVKWLAGRYPDIDIIGGNVATGEAAVRLMKAGAHGVKVGIGPGSICTTRVVCGVGVPQVTAVYECSKALDGKVPVISDGGIRHSGDVPKALTVGANAVMLGSVLAGTEESPGEKIIHQGRQYVVYRGMGSEAALRSGIGSRERYAQTGVRDEDLVPQGVEGIVPYAGTVNKVMTQFCGGLRSSLGYCGCRTVRELQENARCVKISPAGLSEAHPHDVKIMKDAPNYRT
ncbi:MAG: IMP dehydrogenase [Kiritimatiellia bacterium]